MTKKGWLSGGSNDDAESKDNPSSAGSQDANLASSPSDPRAARPTNMRDDRSPETDDGSVNPHNEAMAQKPVADPLDRVGEQDQERLRRPKTDKDRSDALREWGRKARARGNVMSADWEEFQVLTGERQAPITPEDIQAAEKRDAEKRSARHPKGE